LTTETSCGKATILGFFIALAVFMLVSLLSFGVMSQAQLAGPPAAALMANVLEQFVGPCGSVLVRIGLVILVLGTFLGWTLFAAEILYRAASEGVLPAVFGAENAKGSPSGSLWITNLLVQAVLIVTYFANKTYLALFYIASTAILVPYVLSGAYADKLAVTGESYTGSEHRTRDMIFGAVATVYGAWLVYAAGPTFLLMCAALCRRHTGLLVGAPCPDPARVFQP
jgi:arginine:ornithine antiporter / lysine permease